jgi:hypothetical protein
MIDRMRFIKRSQSPGFTAYESANVSTPPMHWRVDFSGGHFLRPIFLNGAFIDLCQIDLGIMGPEHQ